MASITVNKKWYDEVKEMVETVNPYFYTENRTEKVEFDANEEDFNKASKELGWM